MIAPCLDASMLPENRPMQLNRKMLKRWSLMATGLVSTAWLVEVWRMPARSAELLYDDLERIPHNRVGMVLGCVPRLADGRTNLFLTERIAAAARLYHAGKVDYLLVSGDAERGGQDEPAAMRAGLLKLKVPDARIVIDPRGLRTLDSVFRAKLVYGLTAMTIISQRFHNERAAYIAQGIGVAVVGFNATHPEVVIDKMRIREPFARVLAVLDARVLGTQPRYLGEHVVIGHAP